jgi:AcrR family transcriptional regulator
MGPKNSATWHALLDAAERVLRTEGAGAATSRRIAEEAGVTQQLVYYYFKTIEEVLLATFQRRSEAALEKAKETVAPDATSDIWRDLGASIDAKLAFEFMGLSGTSSALRKEVANFLIEWRRLQAEVIAKEWQRKGFDSGPLTPQAAAFLLSNIRFMLVCEERVGVTEGHQDAKDAVEWLLNRSHR